MSWLVTHRFFRYHKTKSVLSKRIVWISLHANQKLKHLCFSSKPLACVDNKLFWGSRELLQSQRSAVENISRHELCQLSSDMLLMFTEDVGCQLSCERVGWDVSMRTRRFTGHLGSIVTTFRHWISFSLSNVKINQCLHANHRGFEGGSATLLCNSSFIIQ